MTNLLRTYPYTVVIILALFAGACSSVAPVESEKVPKASEQGPVKKSPPKGRSYEVKKGDSLSKIALKSTGDLTNWRKIAKYNNISYPYTIIEGQVIVIPYFLTSDEADLTSELKPVDQKPVDKQAETQDSVLYRTRSEPARSVQPDPQKPSRQQKVGGWLIIRGTNYPREINIGPDPSSDILTQVWPGTRLKYVDRSDGWYKVITNKGHGYLNPAYATVSQ